MSIARFVTWGGTGILTTETQDFGLIIKYGVSEKVYRPFPSSKHTAEMASLEINWGVEER